ncbi:MAG: hypothetical protein LC732_01110, partial [Acidobacteria bacterium]|nr:hypothetical protein [Acidobacteriota bacterium]
MSNLFDPRSGSRADASTVGGKAANLAGLQAAGFDVPRWFAVTTEAFASATDGGGTIRPSSALEGEIRAKQREVFGPEVLLAVRSSAADEDAAGDSFAGIHESFLFVRGEEEVIAAVGRVWASARSERAIAYRRERNLPLEGFRMAVVIQEMIDAEVSGVVFTADPADGDTGRVIISSLFGLGEGLVSQGLDADLFTIGKSDGTIEAVIASKEQAVIFDSDGGRGTRRVQVKGERRDAASLAEFQLREVADAALRIERHFRWPQDIEFAFDSAWRLWILQARPITAIDEGGPALGHGLLWDNSNIVESFSGPTSPMTFSVIRRAYAAVYRSFSEVMGIPRTEIARSETLYENMLGYIRGRVYYNLLSWYRLLQLFPGYEYNRQFMESMMGVRQSLAMEEETGRPASLLRRWLVELPALIRLAGVSGWRFLRIRRLVEAFEADFERKFQAWSAIDREELEPHELVSLYEDVEKRTLTQWKPPIINDLFVMVFYGILKKLCLNWAGDESGSLQNDLLAGEGGIVSTEPTRMLMALALEARRDEELARLFSTSSPQELAARLTTGEQFPEWSGAFREYLNLYGFRCMNELKLEEQTLRDRPDFAFQILKNYMAGDPAALDTEAAEKRERAVRKAAEDRAFAAIRSMPKRVVFRRVLGNARLGVKNRENMRFARTRIFGLVREIVRAIGRRWAGDGILDDPADVFYLTLGEVFDFVRGTAVTTRLRDLVEVRRAELAEWKDPASEPDDRFETWGSVYDRNLFRGRVTQSVASIEGELRGIACSPGVVSGRVKVILTPAD